MVNFGFFQMFQDLTNNIIIPISKKLWCGMGEDSLFHNNTFTVAYSKSMDKKLSLHQDESEVTVNYCVGNAGFTGGDIIFKGISC